MTATKADPKKLLHPGVIYSSDNGQLICCECAGNSALYTGRDISGQKVVAVSESENEQWKSLFGESMSCEGGCTSYGS